MSRCSACSNRLPGDVKDWCPLCGAPLAPDARSWDLGAWVPSPAKTPVLRPPEFGAAPEPDSETRPRAPLWRRAAWIGLVLALVGGIGTWVYLLPTASEPDGATGAAITVGQQTHGDISAGRQPNTTNFESYQPATRRLAASDAAPRFLTYDAASGKYGYADETGTTVIEPRFEQAGQFVQGLAPVQVQNTLGSSAYGYIDATGEIVIEPQFRKAFAFSEGLARVEVTVDGLHRFAFIDRNGILVIEPRFVAAWDFSQGLARVGLSDASGLFRYGFIDRTGTLVIEPEFDSARDFSEGLAAVAIGGRWGYIDRTGVWVIEPRYYYALSFVASGLASVDLEDPGTVDVEGVRAEEANLGLHQALIDKTGEVVWERQEKQAP